MFVNPLLIPKLPMGECMSPFLIYHNVYILFQLGILMRMSAGCLQGSQEIQDIMATSQWDQISHNLPE